MARTALCILILGTALLSTSAGAQTILSGYREILNPGGGRRIGEHPAIDFGGRVGDPVLAAADGVVLGVLQDGPNKPCGNGIRLWHVEFNRYTLYCQLDSTKVFHGDTVTRGQLIGLLGFSGEPSWARRPIPMLHFELADQARYRDDGDLAGTYDPMPFIIGCFETGKAYPKDKLVLTYPVACRNK